LTASAQFLNPSEAARRLGVSVKALRLYEQRGLVTPMRTAAGWRAYGPGEMSRVAEIAALRNLGLSLGQVARVLAGDATDLGSALATHQAALEARLHQLGDMVEKVHRLRADLAEGHAPAAADLALSMKPAAAINVAFDLPWPWGGERFELHDIRPLNHIVGPLGSGKTRLAKCLAEALPDADFLGLERLGDGGAKARALLDADPVVRARVDHALSWLIDDGANVSEALIILLVGLEAEGSAALVVDMLEEGLDHATQAALIAYLRRRAPAARPLFFLTRSSAILDLVMVGINEAIIFCPANHSVPTLVAPCPGAHGYEAVASCLASPEVRARTAGIIAWRPDRTSAQPAI
jgi:DNA-binding transcriptional MerR regulator